jgi:hypothetical protein
MSQSIVEVPIMLRSYSAQLNGVELIWLDQPPANLFSARVLVVVDDDVPSLGSVPSAAYYDLTDLIGRLQWHGDAVATQRAQRDAW